MNSVWPEKAGRWFFQRFEVSFARGGYVSEEFTVASGQFLLSDHILSCHTDWTVSEWQDREQIL
jgi:hypothetical protein